MNRMHSGWMVGLALLLGLGACVTVNIYFPAAEVEKAAERIVDDVYGQDRNETGGGGGDQSALQRFLAWLGPDTAWAQEVTSVSNAAIRGLKQTIADNHQKLLPFYRQGAVGIDKDGYLEIRNTQELNLGQVAALRKTVAKDNEARRQLYREVAAALQLDPSNVSRVEEIFARQWREKASAGWWIQKDDGSWSRK
ncbi:DUF1318 domain-containing protein [Desulfovermiculus halophilus]|uniref:DUF1318 domain-containing protein n=1 Tax=Desulfovermiculus halophilus TaxID=339722 RepID=UPI000AB2E2AB|nr:DUF1318 domain-containing protein [Desulfovermiculus halophilus]